jgi:DNA-binding NarL/FixJ family response regulator
MKRITVLLAEDHMVVREGLRNMLELEADFEVVGEAQDGRQAATLAKKLRPDVVLIDIAMLLLNGLEATRQVLKALPGTKVLILSAHSDDAYITNAMESGAAGYILKQTSGHDICRAIREVQKGKTFFSASISRHLERLNRLKPPPLGSTGRLNPKAAQLTQAEATTGAGKSLGTEAGAVIGHDGAGLHAEAAIMGHGGNDHRWRRKRIRCRCRARYRGGRR